MAKYINPLKEKLIFPAALTPGDKIAIVSPASVVKEEYVLGAMEKIMERGYEPVLMKHALGNSYGTFAASKSERLIDIIDTFEDDDIKAILCARGGYGCCQLLANFSPGIIASNPKWIIGFSDVSALLAAWYSRGVASIHGPMAKHLSVMPSEDKCTEALFHILESGGEFDYKVEPHPYNITGRAAGRIKGGNLAVLNDLSGTPDDLLADKYDEDYILFFEDISEPIYKVNRMLYRLYLSGSLSHAKGLIFGRFTEYLPDKNFVSMEDMIHDFIDRNFPGLDIPVVYNFPVGHTDFNLPITVGANVELEVTKDFVSLKTI